MTSAEPGDRGAILRQIQALELTVSLAGTPQPLAIDLPALYPAQQQIKADARRFNVLCIGRRAGKTYLGTHLALECAAAGHPVGWFAPTYKLQQEVWAELARRCRPHASKMNATERRIELQNGGVIELWTMDGSDDPGRGRKYKLAIVDEAAIASNLKAVWEEAIRATLTDLKGAAWFLSTPKGLNYFHELYKRGLDGVDEWRAWQMPSRINPYLDPAEIEAARRDGMTALTFQQEYEAQFITSDGAVFRNVDKVCTAPPTTPAEHRGHVLVAGVDWGRQHDYTACSVVCVNCAREVDLDRYNKVEWAFQRDRLLALFDRWRVRHAVVETNSIGGPNLEALRQYADDGIALQGFETTAKTKPDLIRGLALALERETLLWLPDEQAKHEMMAYEAETLPSGYTRYGAPEGGWDDTVIARALAAQCAIKLRPRKLTEAEYLRAAFPATWQDDYLEKLSPEVAQPYYDARRDELKHLKESLRLNRRPDHYCLGDDGNVGDIV